jgi:hypothetical protein
MKKIILPISLVSLSGIFSEVVIITSSEHHDMITVLVILTHRRTKKMKCTK